MRDLATFSQNIMKSVLNKNVYFFIQAAFFQKLIQEEGDQRSGHSHGKTVGSQGGQAAVPQEQGLEQQDDDPQNADCQRPEEDGSQTGSRHVRAASGYGRDFQGRDHKDKGPGNGDEGQGSAVFLYRIPQGEKACQQKGKADNAPGDAESRGKISFHDVHGRSGGEDPQAQGQAGSDGCQLLLRFCQVTHLHKTLLSFSGLLPAGNKKSLIHLQVFGWAPSSLAGCFTPCQTT